MSIPICPQVALRTATYRWPCIHALGHTGPCRPSDEADRFDVPLKDMPHDRLLTEAILMHSQMSRHNRDVLEQRYRAAEQDQARSEVIDALLSTGSGRTAKHDTTCFTRHVTCLARYWGRWVEMAALLQAANHGRAAS